MVGQAPILINPIFNTEVFMKNSLLLNDAAGAPAPQPATAGSHGAMHFFPHKKKEKSYDTVSFS